MSLFLAVAGVTLFDSNIFALFVSLALPVMFAVLPRLALKHVKPPHLAPERKRQTKNAQGVSAPRQHTNELQEAASPLLQRRKKEDHRSHPDVDPERIIKV